MSGSSKHFRPKTRHLAARLEGKRYKASLSPILLQTGLRFCTSVCSPPWHVGIHRTRAKQQVRRALLLRASCCENRGMGEYRTSAHGVFDIKYHIVWITKYRYKILRGRVAERAGETGAVPEGPVVPPVAGRIWGTPEAVWGATLVGAWVLLRECGRGGRGYDQEVYREPAMGRRGLGV